MHAFFQSKLQTPLMSFQYALKTDTMLIMVQTLTGKGVEINIQPTDTVLRIKELFEEKEGIPPPQQRFVMRGRILEDCETVNECLLSEGSVIHLVLPIRGSHV